MLHTHEEAISPAPQLSSTSTSTTEALLPTTMRALVHGRYGDPMAPGVLALGTVKRPVAGPGQVTVAVHAANASIGDHHIVEGRPLLVRASPYGGLPCPRNPVPGAVFSGVVVEVGAGVVDVAVGDAVMGEARCGAFAEYIVVSADVVAPVPTHLSLEEAAAVPWAMAAFQGLRDAGRLQAGQRVVINGASGGVGTWAVQLAKAMGAHVTAVCSTRHLELVGRLGADVVVDYTVADVTAGADRFDVFFDTVANHSLSACLRIIEARGVWVGCAGGGGALLGPLPRMVWVALRSISTTQTLTSFMATPNQRDLRALSAMCEAHRLRPVLERVVPLHDGPQALHQVGLGHSQGQSIIRVAGAA